jgi:cytidylate kinase
MAVVTVSRQAGSLGDEIAAAVAEKLSYNYVDKAKIGNAMENQGLPVSDFERFDGRKPSIWQSFTHQKKKFIHLLRATLYDFARSGNVVIIGRGGQALLKDIAGTLHVRIVAPFETRIQRLMDQEGYDKKKSEQHVILNDHDSAGFIRSFFDIEWDDENMYDLVLNTRTMSVGAAASLIHAAIKAQEFSVSSQQIERKLMDMSLEEKSRGVLAGFPGIDVTNIEVTDGVVVLSGLARSGQNIEECQTTVSRIEGVKKVRSKMDIVTIAGI